MTAQLMPDHQAPDFSLQDSQGAAVSPSDYRGRSLVVYFYPAAFTPGCTTEACDFRDNLASLASAGYAVVGISSDPIEKLSQFAESESLTFPLLSDPDSVVAREWGAWDDEQQRPARSTIVLDEQGRVSKTYYAVSAQGHVAQLRRDLGID